MATNNKDWISLGCAVQAPLWLLAFMLSPLVIGIKLARKSSLLYSKRI